MEHILTEPCLEWAGRVDKDGYGKLYRERICRICEKGAGDRYRERRRLRRRS